MFIRAEKTPLMISENGEVLAQMSPLPRDTKLYDEKWLQKKLFELPSLLPIHEMEGIEEDDFLPLIPL